MASIRLAQRDLRLLLDAAGRCGDATPCEPSAVEDVLDAVAGLVRCDIAFWNRYHLVGHLHEDNHVAAPSTAPALRAPLGPWLEHLDEHPIMSGRHGAVTMLSDVLPGDALKDTWLFQEALAPEGIRSEIGLELSHDRDEMNVIVLSRGEGAPFVERDRLVLLLIRPFVDDAIRHFTQPRARLTRRQRDVSATCSVW